MKKIDVEIGISAYNESANIQQILTDITTQQLPPQIELKKITVISDGSSDDTVAQANAVRSEKIVVIEGKKRKGKAARLNELFSQFESEIGVILDADIRILDKNTLSTLIAPIVKRRADLTSARIEEFAPTTFVSKVLYISMIMKKQIFEAHDNGNNVYTCHGRARAFSKKFYKKFHVSFSPSEDAYSYIACKLAGFQYQFTANARVYYKLPQSLADHERQSIRFINSQSMFSKEIDQKLIKELYALPTAIVVHVMISTFIAHPILLTSYCAMTVLTKWKALTNTVTHANWEISRSTK